MKKFKTVIEYVYNQNNINLNAYSVSDNCDTLLDKITSLINNIQRESFNCELSYNYINYVTKDEVKILYMKSISFNGINKKKLIVSLTNDIALLIECLFYVAINYRDIDSIEYLINNYANTENIKNLTCICTECHVEPLKYIILNNYNNKFSLKKLACRKIRSSYKYEDIDRLSIPNLLREYIKTEYMIREIFYNKDNSLSLYKYSYSNYLNIINKYCLSNIVNYRLLVKGVEEFNYNTRVYNNVRKKYILYCEVLSYDTSPFARVSNIKYFSITFYQYEYNKNYTPVFINNEILEQLPEYYNLIPKRQIYFSITAGSFNEANNSIVNEVFEFMEIDNIIGDSKGYYKLNLGLFLPNKN